MKKNLPTAVKLFLVTTIAIGTVNLAVGQISKQQTVENTKKHATKIITSNDGKSVHIIKRKNSDIKYFSPDKYSANYSIRDVEEHNDSIVDIIVEFKEEPLFLKQKKNAHLKSSAFSNRAQKTGYENRLKEFRSALSSLGRLKSSTVQPKIKREYYKIFFGASAKVSREAYSKIKKLPYVKKVHFNKKVKAILTESVPLIQADKVWTDLGTEGEDIKVGIIDTGIDYTHPALGGHSGSTFPTAKVIGGYDFVNNDDDPIDDHFHGTHCAAIVAADNEVIKGVAPKALLYAYKSLGSGGSGSTDDVIAAVERCIDPNEDGDYSDKLDVVSMSLGNANGNPDDALCIAVDNAVEMGIVFSIAAGNNGQYNTIGSPGTARKAITVGSTIKSDQISGFSSKGPNALDCSIKPEVVAPGSDIYSAVLNGKYEAHSGTSMATPHVAGICALLKKLHPAWSPEQIKSALMTTAVDIGLDVMAQGAGRVNAYKAATATTFADPSCLGFGLDDISRDIWTVSDTVTITNTNENLQTYTVSIPDLPDGIAIETNVSELTLGANESAAIIFTLTVDNSIVEYPNTKSQTYDGVLSINGTIDQIKLPWAFVKATMIYIKFDIPFENCHILSEDNTRYYSVRGSDYMQYTFALLEKGSYDLVAFLDDPNNNDVFIVMEKFQLEATDTLHISATKAKYNIKAESVNKQGKLFNNMATKENIDHLTRIGIHYPDPSSPKRFEMEDNFGLNYYVSEIPDGAHVRLMECLTDLHHEKEVAFVAYDSIKTLNNDTILRNSPSDFLYHRNVNITFPTSAENPSIFFLADGIFVPGNSFTINSKKWEGNLYIASSQSKNINYTNDVKLIAFDDLYSSIPYIFTDPFATKNDSIGNFWPHEVITPDIYLSPSNGDKIYYGSSFIHPNLDFFENHKSSDKISVSNPRFYGQMREERQSDLHNSKLTIYNENNNPIYSDMLSNFQDKNVPSGKYRFEIINENYAVEDIAGKGTFNAFFDLESDDYKDKIPPQINSLQLLNSKGVPAPILELGKPAQIQCSFRNFYSTVNHLRLFLKEHGTDDWRELSITKTSSDFFHRQHFTIDISSFTVKEGYYDVKMELKNTEESKIEWTLEPAFTVVKNITTDTEIPIALSANNDILVYPNPNTGTFKLKIPETTAENGEIEVYNMQGQLVFNKNLALPLENEETVTINLTAQRKGIYLLKITLDNQIFNEKILVH